jgi:asparaginyl-tRNA synthetase
LAHTVRILGNCPGESYPIQKLENSSEFLRTNALNFRLRAERDSSLARLKSEAAYSLLNNLRNADFIRIFPPILTEHDCEGGGEVFRVEAERVNFFSSPAYLTVSTQLHLEIAAASLSRVYSLSPVFRAENQHTTKHLSEFWMLECEISFLDNLELLLKFIEILIKSTVKDISASCRADALDESRTEGIISKPFAIIPYTEAIKVLSGFKDRFKYPLEWGNDLQTEHERFLAETIFKGPVFVTDYPSKLKPFYMKTSDDKKTALCCDLLMPGIGEIAGGSLREDDYSALKENMKQKLGFEGDKNPLQWYLDLRKFGTTPHGGFGLGFDRLLQYISGTNNIRDTVMIPRYSGSIKF